MTGRISRTRRRLRRRFSSGNILLGLFCISLLLKPGFLSAIHVAAAESGTVVRVTDGDTISVRFADGIERRVRLIGVDAPEMDDPREDVAYRAFLSKRFAFHHLFRRDVSLTYDFSPLDEHGRVLAYVWPEGRELFNEFIIRQGFAAAFLKYPFRKEYQGRFRAAEAEAREDKRGLWSPDEPAIISVLQVKSHIGEVISVRFRCSGVSKQTSYLYLHSADGDFEVPVPRSRLPFLPGIECYAGKEMIVSGFLEEFRGRPQIMLFFLRQLRLT